LEKHLFLCEFLAKAKKNNYKETDAERTEKEEKEEEEVPSPKVMYKLLLELGRKYNRLEEKMENVNLKKKKTKQVEIVDWLNKNSTPHCRFEHLTDQVHVQASDVEHLLNHTFYETFTVILYRTLSDENSVSLPLFAFVQKPNHLYIYDTSESDGGEDSSSGVWTELSRGKLVRFLNIIHKKISKSMFEWKRSRLEEINNSDQFATVFDKALLKLMRVDFKNDATLVKIKSLLYSRLKTDVNFHLFHL